MHIPCSAYRDFLRCIYMKWNPWSWTAPALYSVRMSTSTQTLLIGIPQFGQVNIWISPYIGHDHFHFISNLLHTLGNSSEPWSLRSWHRKTNHEIWGEMYIFSCSALRYFVLHRVSSSLLRRNILLSSLFSSTPSLCALPSRWETKFLAVETNNSCLLSSVNYSEETH